MIWTWIAASSWCRAASGNVKPPPTRAGVVNPMRSRTTKGSPRPRAVGGVWVVGRAVHEALA